MRRVLVAAVAALALGAIPDAAAGQRRLSVAYARKAIHHADAYAVIGRCHRTRYSVICRVTHELEAYSEDGTSTTGVIHIVDRVHWRRGHAVVSVLWEGTTSVSI